MPVSDLLPNLIGPVIIILLIMAEMAVILPGLYTPNEGDSYRPQFTASPPELIQNKFRIYSRWHIRWRNLWQFFGCMKNSYMAPIWRHGIRTWDLPDSMAITMDKWSHTLPVRPQRRLVIDTFRRLVYLLQIPVTRTISLFISSINQLQIPHYLPGMLYISERWKS